MDITQALTQLCNRVPYSSKPIFNQASLGWNRRWDWDFAHNFVYRYCPQNLSTRILAAGCRKYAETQYLTYQNPLTEILGKDLSDTDLTIDRAQCHCAEVPLSPFQQGSLLELGKDPCNFINGVGVLQPQPKTGKVPKF
jgi:hypothetical protein